MSPVARRVLQAVLYEFLALLFVAPVLSMAFGETFGSSMALAVLMSSVALCWNYVFNLIFERWESRQATGGRSFWRRLAHGVGFEGGLVVMLVPVMAYWLDTSLWKAFLADVGFLIFFFVYALVFIWAFDRIFGLPESARHSKQRGNNE